MREFAAITWVLLLSPLGFGQITAFHKKWRQLEDHPLPKEVLLVITYDIDQSGIYTLNDWRARAVRDAYTFIAVLEDCQFKIEFARTAQDPAVTNCLTLAESYLGRVRSNITAHPKEYAELVAIYYRTHPPPKSRPSGTLRKRPR
jgi:hypothetical protein